MKSKSFWLLVAIVLFSAAAVHSADTKLAVGTAAGTFTALGKDTKLAYAAAFVDQKDERKPTVLILSDKKLPVTSWKSETDFMMGTMNQKFIGVVFYIDKSGEVYRADYFDGTPFSTSSSGLFDLKLDSGKALSGSATSTASAAKMHEPVKLDVKFNAAR